MVSPTITRPVSRRARTGPLRGVGGVGNNKSRFRPKIGEKTSASDPAPGPSPRYSSPVTIVTTPRGDEDTRGRADGKGGRSAPPTPDVRTERQLIPETPDRQPARRGEGGRGAPLSTRCRVRSGPEGVREERPQLGGFTMKGVLCSEAVCPALETECPSSHRFQEAGECLFTYRQTER